MASCAPTPAGSPAGLTQLAVRTRSWAAGGDGGTLLLVGRAGGSGPAGTAGSAHRAEYINAVCLKWAVH